MQFYYRVYAEHISYLSQEWENVETYNQLSEFISKHQPAKKTISISYINNSYEEKKPQYDKCELLFQNSFFGLVNNKNSIQNWVDIENEYYAILKDCLKEGDSRKYNIDVSTLNREFEEIKNLFEEYLYSAIEQSFDFDELQNADEFSDIFKINARFLEAGANNKYLKEFPEDDHDDLILYDSKYLQALNSEKTEETLKEITYLTKTCFLSFNYTPTVKAHIKNFIDSDVNYYGNNQVIHIHGKLKDKNDRINFGFGDEMDSHYKLIEEKDDNEYLKNIKSFQYLQNSNYKDLLDFIDSEKFQVYIMGHSCGLSDRILLNTIFEHEHCRSIKVFYHEKDGKDNYTDIVQNISRHFNKKKMMRDKLVNKSLCQPLPQNIRFAEKK